MLFIYSILLIIIICLTLIFYNYKKGYRDISPSKSFMLKPFFGISLFLMDTLGSILKSRGIKDPSSQSTARGIALTLCIMASFMVLGTIYSIKGTSNITSLPRPSDGSETSTYSLKVETESTTEYVDLEVSKKMYEYGQVISIFDSYREDILAAMLKENPSADKVSLPLNFIQSIGSENICLKWQPEDLSYIDYNGNITYENISPEGTFTSIYVSMELDDITASLVIGVTLYPMETVSDSTLISQIKEFIKHNNSPSQDYVLLPTSLSKGSVSFSLSQDNVDYIFLLLAIVSIAAIWMLIKRDKEKKQKHRETQMLQDYPEIVSKLLLLCNAGLNTHSAFKKIVDDYKNTHNFKPRHAYEELSITVNSLQSGGSESYVYTDFGRRCGLMPYMQLGSLLEQNIKKGSKELSYHLNTEVRNAFENHKSAVITQSKIAETKLLFPMMLMLIIVIALIIVPSFMNI